MKPGAQLQTAIELLDRLGAETLPVDKLLANWGRNNRYAGSRDRAAIANTIYGVLRRREQLDWWLARCGGAINNRMRVITYHTLSGLSLSDLTPLFDGGVHTPPPLSSKEQRVVIELTGQSFDHNCQPIAVRGNVPGWLEQPLTDLYGAKVAAQLEALAQEAPVDLRVNSLKTTRDEAQAVLAAEGIEAVPTSLSPLGLRLTRRRPLSSTKAFREGLVEVQDEGSQLAALLTDARPKMKVVDFCAGAGGKTLALAATMQNKGRLIVCDISQARLKRASLRLRRAGVFVAETRLLSSERDKWIKRRAAKFDGGFDRVLADAPCSGSGTWRRNPDQKMRLTPEDVVGLTERQLAILTAAARLVRPGGRLVYVTCSLLRAENEAVVERFLKTHPTFHIHPIAPLWQEVLKPPCPMDTPMLRLTPLEHGTDGFFVAVLGRQE